MKKISLFAAVILILALLSVDVAATSLSDSLRIGRDTYEMLSVTEEDTVIRLYNGAFFDGFAKGVPILTLTGDEYVTSQVYMTRSQRGADTFRTISDGEPRKLDGRGRRADGKCIYDVVSKPERVLPRSADIDNVYCLDGERGIYIYFVTDGGDYVYYKKSAENEDEYLFPAETFTEYAKAALGGDAFDMTPFLIAEELDLFMVAASVIAVIGTIALCCCTVLLRG